ncbi:MAG: tetratricopeptide repeat protein [Pseudomonadota bacterium]
MRPILLALTLLLAPPALAETPERAALLDSLATARDRVEADETAALIWESWLTAPDAEAQAGLDAALARLQVWDYPGALTHLDRLVESHPDYAEGWNQRATVHFLVRDYDASLADIDEVLAREPRHFGALAGKAVILMRQGRVPFAQLTIRQALEIHPFLNERALLDAAPGEDL